MVTEKIKICRYTALTGNMSCKIWFLFFWKGLNKNFRTTEHALSASRKSLKAVRFPDSRIQLE